MTPDRAGQAGEIFRWMEAALVGESQATARVEIFDRGVVGPIDLHPDLATGVIFLAEVGNRAFVRGNQIAAQSPEIAVDRFLAANRLDPVHRGDLAFVI